MDENNQLLGCFVLTSADSKWHESDINLAFEQGKLFRTYIWGENGINRFFDRLDNESDLARVM